VKDIADRAEALRCYARQAHDPELELSVAEIRLRAQRRIGELSRDLDRVQGENLPNVSPSGHSGKRATLAAAGVSKSQAHRCEQIAAVPADAFEALLATARERKRPLPGSSRGRRAAGVASRYCGANRGSAQACRRRAASAVRPAARRRAVEGSGIWVSSTSVRSGPEALGGSSI
jgi:hypothetical protein